MVVVDKIIIDRDIVNVMNGDQIGRKETEAVCAGSLASCVPTYAPSVLCGSVYCL